jgi:hypothetical protein
MTEEIEIEPGAAAGSYIGRTDWVSFSFNVKPGAAWHELDSAAAEKLESIRATMPRHIVILSDGSTFDDCRGSVVAINAGDWRPDSDDPMPNGCELVPVSELVRRWTETRR